MRCTKRAASVHASALGWWPWAGTRPTQAVQFASLYILYIPTYLPTCLPVRVSARLHQPAAGPSLPRLPRLPPVAVQASFSAPADSLQANAALQAVIKEVSALMDLGQHPNIIRFVGVCIDPPRIVTEYYK